MLGNREERWINACLLNLCVVALFGFLLRNKILFPLPFLDYRNLLSAHSHFAFAGWAGLSLMVLFVYKLLPQGAAQKRSYQWLLIATEVSAVGMALTFPFVGYNGVSIALSSLYIVANFAFAPLFIKDMAQADKTVRLLSLAAIGCLLLSAIGPLGLVYILVAKSSNSILYRDSIYTFLHFQYNGFFTLAVFALFFNHVVKRGVALTKAARRFAVFLCLSVPPGVFLALLWHNLALFYALAAIGCVLMLTSLFFFLAWLRQLPAKALFEEPFARTLWGLAAFSFALKMLLNIGTIFPALGQMVYGDRPVIIGFLHLVFLGFLTFFLLAALVEAGYFKRAGKTVRYPFVVFGAGIILNELFLGLQGLSNLLRNTSAVYNWLLWGGTMLLFAGAVLLFTARLRSEQPTGS